MGTYYNETAGEYRNYENAVVEKLKDIANSLSSQSGDAIEIVAGIRYDTDEQGLTSEQQANARTNIDAVSSAELEAETAARNEAIAGKAVRYDAAQELTSEQKARALANIGAGEKAVLVGLDRRVNLIHRLVNYDYSTDFDAYYITRRQTLISITADFQTSSSPYRWVINGEVAGLPTSSSTHPGLVLTNGHTYRLRMIHTSGTATNTIGVMWTEYQSTSRVSGTSSVTDGEETYTDIVYSTTAYPDGLWPTVYASRAGGNKITAYTCEVLIEDITDAVAPVTDVLVDGVSVVSSGVASITTDPTLTVSGTTPVITALPGTRYICGECATLDITLPDAGCVDVVFESGSTPTVLTVTPPTGVTVKWANDFDPTSLEADTTYEINIMDGLGVVGAWT